MECIHRSRYANTLAIVEYVHIISVERRTNRSYNPTPSDYLPTSCIMSTVAPVFEFANLSTRRLFNCALLKFVQQLWFANYDHLKGFTKEEILGVKEYFLEHYPDLPAVIRSQVINVIERMGAEMAVFYDSLIQSHFDRNPKVRLVALFWTSQFTLDRMKTIESCEKTGYLEGCKCSLAMMQRCTHLPVTSKAMLQDHFGKYWVVVFNYYTTFNGHARSIEKFMHRFSHHLEEGPLEDRLFKFFVINGNIECFDYFTMRMTDEKLREIILESTINVITRKYSCDPLTSQHLTAQIVISLWKYLDVDDHRRIIQNHSTEFCAFLLFLPGVDPLIPAIRFYKPSIADLKKNRNYLQEAASRISLNIRASQQHRCFFRYLYTRTRNSLSDIDILHLLEAVLAVDDVETASMMVRMMDQHDRDKLLDAVPKVWNDLWKATIESETFFSFFFDVQAHSLLGKKYFTMST